MSVAYTRLPQDIRQHSGLGGRKEGMLLVTGTSWVLTLNPEVLRRARLVGVSAGRGDVISTIDTQFRFQFLWKIGHLHQKTSLLCNGLSKALERLRTYSHSSWLMIMC